MIRDAPASSSARACPPRPTVQSTKTPPRSGARCASTSATITGVCPGWWLVVSGGWSTTNYEPSTKSNSVLRQQERIGIGPRFALQLLSEAFRVPHIDVIDASKHANFADNRCALAQV